MKGSDGVGLGMVIGAVIMALAGAIPAWLDLGVFAEPWEDCAYTEVYTWVASGEAPNIDFDYECVPIGEVDRGAHTPWLR